MSDIFFVRLGRRFRDMAL